MKLTPTPETCRRHYLFRTQPCLYVDCVTDERFLITQVKCSECGKVFEEKREGVK